MKNYVDKDKIDFHFHVKEDSFDATNSSDRIIENNSCKFLASTNHDCMDNYIDLCKQHNYSTDQAFITINGSFHIPAVEFTCVLPDYNNLKIHMLVYFPMASCNHFIQLLKLKRNNDIEVEYGIINFVAKSLNIQISNKKFRNFVIEKRNLESPIQTFGKQQALEFFDYLFYENSPYEQKVRFLISSYVRAERLCISAYDLIKIVNFAGGICAIAHPQKNLSRSDFPPEVILNDLVKAGMQGIELECLSNSTGYKQFLKEYLEQHPSLFAFCGSDSHTSNIELGTINKKPLLASEHERLCRLVFDMQKARNNGLKSIFQDLTDNKECNDILSTYKQRNAELRLQHSTALAESMKTTYRSICALKNQEEKRNVYNNKM